MAEHTGSDIRPREEMSNSLSRVELYHKIMHDNKKLIYEIKIGIVSIIGSIIVVACIIYIVFQCKRSSKYVYNFVKNRRPSDDHKRLIGSSDSTENLLTTTTTSTTLSSSPAALAPMATTLTTKTMTTTMVTETKIAKSYKPKKSYRQTCNREFYV